MKSALQRYADDRLSMLIPSAVRVKSPAPNFLATGKRGSLVLALAIDPGPDLERSWLNLLRTRYHDTTGMLTTRVIRQGERTKPPGLERIIEIENPIGEVVLTWMLALYPSGVFVQGQLTAPGTYADNEIPWRECIDSISFA